LSQLPSNTLSELLANWQAGDEEALRAVFPRVYNELRRVAHRYLKNERPDHTLQSAALVHEAYLRLEKQGTGRFENREHFIAICAQLMRQILWSTPAAEERQSGMGATACRWMKA
jgi:RNA polymerase sigma factor (TIGR02999 family)